MAEAMWIGLLDSGGRTMMTEQTPQPGGLERAAARASFERDKHFGRIAKGSFCFQIMFEETNRVGRKRQEAHACAFTQNTNLASLNSRSSSLSVSTSCERSPLSSIKATIPRSRAVWKLFQKRSTCSRLSGVITRCGTFIFRSAELTATRRPYPNDERRYQLRWIK